MKVIEFYVNDEFKKTAKLYCDSVYFRKSDGSILCLRSFQYLQSQNNAAPLQEQKRRDK